MSVVGDRELGWREHGGVRWLETRLEGAVVAFTTRTGGASEGEYSSLNLAIHTDDDPDRVLANRLKLADALGLDPERIAIASQVHGSDLVSHRGAQSPAPFADPVAVPPEADGHHTEEAGLALAVFVADCLPIGLQGPGGVAMLHGGWRGLAEGIIERGVEAVSAEEAVIGPGIGPCCFEVGEEVLAAFGHLGDDLSVGRMLNLPAVAEGLLRRAGVASISRSRLCTRCNSDLLFSHRGQGPVTGRSAGLIWKPAS